MIKKYFLLLLPFALPLYVVRFQIGPIPTTLLEVVILISFLAWLTDKIRKNSPWLTPSNSPLTQGGEFRLPILLFFLASIISIFVAQDTIGALGLWRAYFLEPLMIFVMLGDIIKTGKDRNNLLLGLLGITLLISSWAILQKLGILSIPSPWNIPPQGIRATGPFPFPNAVALFLVPLGALFISYFTKETTPNPSLSRRGKNYSSPLEGEVRRGLLILGFLAAFIAAFLAKSDGGMIALIAAAGVALLLNKKSRIPTLITSAIILLGIISIPTIREPVAQKVFFQDWSGKVRLVMWEETTRMIQDRPILGAGLGAYPDVITQYDHAEWMEVFQYPHNIILNFWSELGLLGLIAFGWILIRWYRSNPTVVLPILTALLVHGLVDVPYFKNDLAILFWILIAITQIKKSSTSSS